MTHPDGDGWERHVGRVSARPDRARRAEGVGPVKGTPPRAGFLIFEAANIDEVKRLIAGDPFARHDLIVSLTVEEWDPLFGAFEAKSSRTLAAAMKALEEKGLYPIT